LGRVIKMDPTTAAACILVLCLALVVFAYALGIEQGKADRPRVAARDRKNYNR
jgi:hypothetical protein